MRQWLAACVVVILTCSATQALNRQAQPPPNAALRFEVASLKGMPPPVSGASQIQVSPGRIVQRCTTLRSLLGFAYRLGLSSTVNGLPTWAHGPCNNLYSSPDTFEFQATMPAETTDAEMRQMMQTFLKDRFKLALHVETRNMSGYELVVAPGGFKLKPTNRDDDNDWRRANLGSLFCPPEDERDCRLFALGSTSTARLADVLSYHVARPVVDRTDLTETYRFDLLWASPTRPNSPLPALPTALQEKFGLELKSFNGPVDTYTVDHVERPSPD